MTPYEPERYAFRFPNSFVNHVWSGRIPPLIGRTYNIKTSGRCGGMAFASLDFYHLETPVPSLEPQDFSPARVPSDGHPLNDYIYKRQLHSMLTSPHETQSGLRYVYLSGLPAQTMLHKSAAEERKAIDSLDRGEPVVLGLIKATSRGLTAQGVNHQVVCYDYRTTESGRFAFYVYDPNVPFRVSSSTPYEVILRRTRDHERSVFPYELIRPDNVDRWRGFFVQQYHPYPPDRRVMNAQAA